MEAPIAWFNRSLRRVVDDRLTASVAFLALRPEAEAMREMVLASFFIVEQRRRMREKENTITAGRAASQAT